ncbi:MAG: DUF1294 domain-containing protein [Candidatus Moraniibacteriota bacterium]
MLSPDTLLLAVFLAINVAAFLIMGWDKQRSRQSGAERIPEGLLFFIAITFGSVGVLVGMFVFRHKTQTWYFLLGVPLTIIQNIATLRVLAWLLDTLR